MDRLVRLQAASNYTGLGSRSAGERYVVVYLAPGAAGQETAEATLQLNDERKAVPAEFADGLAGLLEKSGLYGADGLTEWNPELPPTIGFHALACEFESGRIFKTSASGFSEVWAAFAAPFMELVKAQFGRPVPAPEEAGETREPGETPAEPVPETAAAAEPVQPIDLGPVADEPAEELPDSEPEADITDSEPDAEEPSDELASCEPEAEEPAPEYAVGSEEEEWAPEYDDLNGEIKTADAELSLMDAELDSASAKLDYAEARLEDIETALDAAQAALIDAEAELDMYRDGFAEPPVIDPKHIDEI